jgi:superkiller protein 3
MWFVLAALLAMPPDDPFRSIEKLIAAGQYSAALSALSKQPSSSFTWHLLASKAYDGLNDPARAVQEAEAALAIDAKQESAHLQLGQIFLGHNTPKAAEEIFSDGLAIFPDSFFLRLGKGLALKELQRYEDAEKELRLCLGRQPGFPVAFDALATVYAQTQRFEELERLSAEQMALVPKDYRGPYYAAAALDGLRRDTKRTETLLSDSIRLNPNYAAAHALLGKVRLREGDVAGAIPELEEALRLRPEYTPAAMQLGQAYKRAGRTEDAAKAFARVRELNERPSPPSLLYHRGKK